jgi:transcriptional regulator with XRE-family HTH domain
MATKTPTKKNPLATLVGDKQYSDLAKALGVTRSYICRIMKGNREPSLSIARKLAIALDVSLDTLAEALAGVKSKYKVTVVRLTRSSVDGKFVTKAAGKKSPATTQRETVKR